MKGISSIPPLSAASCDEILRHIGLRIHRLHNTCRSKATDKRKDQVGYAIRELDRLRSWIREHQEP